MDIETLKKISALSDRILNMFDEAPDLTRGDFQRIIEAIILKTYEVGGIKKPTPTAGAGNKKKFDYVNEQFKKLFPFITEYNATLQIRTITNQTNWMDITVSQLNKIKLILAGG